MIVARLTDEGAGVEQIAILSPHKDGDAGCEAANLKTRDVLGFDPRKIEKDDLLIVSRNNYHTPVTEDPEREETIYNGERCTVIKCGSDYLDLEFPQNSEGLTRRVTLLMKQKLNCRMARCSVLRCPPTRPRDRNSTSPL